MLLAFQSAIGVELSPDGEAAGAAAHSGHDHIALPGQFHRLLHQRLVGAEHGAAGVIQDLRPQLFQPPAEGRPLAHRRGVVAQLIVDGIGIDDGVGVEVFCRGA